MRRAVATAVVAVLEEAIDQDVETIGYANTAGRNIDPYDRVNARAARKRLPLLQEAIVELQPVKRVR